MKNPVWLLKWILKAAIFFTLFAFALNNQHEASVHFFFGNQWRSPMVLIVLAAFALGLECPVSEPWPSFVGAFFCSVKHLCTISGQPSMG